MSNYKPLGTLRFLALALALSASALPAQAQPKQQRQSGLSATQYVTMHPFILPIMTDGAAQRQYTIVLAIEMAREGVRDEILFLTPRIRDALYPELYRLVAFRNREPRIISTSALKRKLTPIVQRVTGTDLVKAVVVQDAYESDLP